MSVLLLALSACTRGELAATAEHPSVVLIVIDTLRADALGSYGGPRGLTPRLDSLAVEGAAFANTFSHAPWTLPSFASLLTSNPPQAHGAGGKADDYRALHPSIPTVPERFHAAGYATGAVVNVDFLARPFGVTRGLEHLDVCAFESNEKLRDASRTTDAALAYVRAHRDEAFFLMVHYFDPHAEYRPPLEFRRRFAAAPDREDEAFRFGTRQQVVLRRAGRLELLPEDLERARRLYEAEVAYVDQEIGRLLDRLSDLGIDETTLVVVTADHGEEFLDHGDWEHGHTLYDELLRVPLLLRQPGRVPARRIDAAVGLVDLGPTLLAWCGLPPCDSFRGRDLAPALAGAELAETDFLAFGNFWGPPLASLRRGEFELIAKPQGPFELYRWTTDPGMQNDLAASDRPTVDRMQAALDAAQAEALRSGRGLGPPVRLTTEETRRLEAVGYAGDEGGDEAGDENGAKD